MTLRIISAAEDTEGSDSFHVARLLMLLRPAAIADDGAINGIMKLAKFDFLIRYPVYLEKVLSRARRKPPAVTIQDHERHTVESKMIRFRYGPWDPRYRRWIGILVAKQLCETYLKGRTVFVRLTDRGKTIADQIAKREEFHDLAERGELIYKTLGKKSGTWLKDTIYEAVPELMGMAWGEEIEP